MVELMTEYQNHTPFFIRIAFVIANLTTYFEEAREQIAESKETFSKLLHLAIAYLKKDLEEDPSS